MANFVVTGGSELQALGASLKVLGASGLDAPIPGVGLRGASLRAQLLAGIREAARPAAEKTRPVAESKGPHRGGLDRVVSTSEIKVSTKLAGPRVGVRITNSSRGGRGINTGEIRHPVFAKGPRENWHWVKQTFTRADGWFDDTLRKQQPYVAAKISAVMNTVTLEVLSRRV